MLHMTRLFASNNISQMSVSARYKQNRREASEEGAGAALHPGKEEFERSLQSLHYHYTSGYALCVRNSIVIGIWKLHHSTPSFVQLSLNCFLYINVNAHVFNELQDIH